jgi:pilus assembly protein CpaB
MRRGGRLFIVLGVGLALVAVALVAVVLLSGGDDPEEPSSSQPPDSEEAREITVVVAARDIPAHTTITQDDVREEQVQSNEVSEDAVRSSLEVIGLAYSVDLVTGQPILAADVEQPGLANLIDPGRRAYTLPVTGSQLVGGLLRDDDHIDLIFSTWVAMNRIMPTYPLELPENLELRDVVDPETGEPAIVLPPYGDPPAGPTYPYYGEDGSRFWLTDTADGDPITNVMIQNVRILRVVSATEGEAGTESEDNFLILDLDPVQAELVEFLSKTGQMQIVLRNPEDQEIPETPGITMNALVDDWGMRVPRTVRLPGAGAQ